MQVVDEFHLMGCAQLLPVFGSCWWNNSWSGFIYLSIKHGLVQELVFSEILYLKRKRMFHLGCELCHTCEIGVQLQKKWAAMLPLSVWILSNLWKWSLASKDGQRCSHLGCELYHTSENEAQLKKKKGATVFPPMVWILPHLWKYQQVLFF